jgi:hypothetical protein
MLINRDQSSMIQACKAGSCNGFMSVVRNLRSERAAGPVASAAAALLPIAVQQRHMQITRVAKKRVRDSVETRP